MKTDFYKFIFGKGFLKPLLIAVIAFSSFNESVTAQSNGSAVSFSAVSSVMKTNAESYTPVYVSFKNGEEPSFNNFENWFSSNMKLSSDFGLQLINSNRDAIGFTHYRYTQTFQSLPINNSMIIVHVRNNQVISFNGEMISTVTVSSVPALAENEALTNALRFVGAKSYKWQFPAEEAFIKKEQGNEEATFFPKGELMFSKSETGGYKLAYRFDIYAEQPLSRKYVFVDALNGAVISYEDIIEDVNAPGTAVTAYSGSQPITTDDVGGSFRLRETGRGLGIETYNAQSGIDFANAIDFTDADNIWNNVNAAKDEYATDAHFGAEKTYDYYFNTYGRNGIDGAGYKLLNYVHTNFIALGYTTNINAKWDGTRMFYGDGGSGYNPLTALDIVGHEITHGLTQNTAHLIYSLESGAMNEGFSDIFGTTIEFYATPSQADWTIGEDVSIPFRSMSNPNQYGQPDTYQGTNWYIGNTDNGGVHTNSGVLNYWYYLLTQGGTGTNDLGNKFSVSGIGITKSAAIAYRSLTVYLTPSSKYADARTYSIQSAEDLYGVCSPEAIATAAAWYAVGVGNLTTGVAPTIYYAGGTTTFCSGSNLTLNANPSANYQWKFNGGNIAGATNSSYTASQIGFFTVSTTYCNNVYTSTSTYLNASNPAVVVSAPVTSSCSNILLSSSATAGYGMQWMLNGAPINGATSSTYLATQSGNYSAVISGNSTAPVTFTNAGPVGIIERNCIHTTDVINVSGLPASINPAEISISINVTHAADAELIMWLESPAGDRLGLAYFAGGNNANFTNTVFSDAGKQLVGTGSAPFTGVFKPMLAKFTICGITMTKTNFAYLGAGAINPNGAWKLHFVDAVELNLGTLNSWQITFPPINSPNPNCGPVTSNILALTISNSLSPVITPSGPTTFCQGGSVSLAASGGTNYLWSTGAITQTIMVNSSGNYSVSVTNSTGCSGSVSQSVTVNSLPIASVISAGGSTTFCMGGSVLLNGNSTGGTWSVGGSNTSTLLATTTGDYFITSSNSCGSTTSNHIAVTVNPLPIASVISAGGPISFCDGGSVLLSGNSTSGIWSVGGSNTSTLLATTSGDYFVTTSNSCGSTTSNHIAVTVNPLPAASVISANGSVSFCDGGSVLLSGNSTSGIWSIGGSNTSTLLATTNGDYFVTTSNSCGSIASNHIAVTVNPLPAASVISANGSVSFCDGGSVLLSGNSTSGIWSVGGSNTSTLLVATSGDYFVTTSNSCGSIASNHISVTVNPIPVVDAGTYASVSASDPSFALSGTPSGGTFSGTGVTGGNTFNPSVSGAGSFNITYFYTDVNGCSNSAQTLIVVTAPCTFTVGTVTGPTNACPYMGAIGTTASYTVTSSNAIGFTWTIPAGSTLFTGQGTNSISFKYPSSFVSGNVQVVVSSNCGSPVTQLLAITKAPPVTPGPITGPISACDFRGTLTQANYSIAPVPFAISYTWTLPANVVLVSGQGTTSINVTFNAAYTSSTFYVKAVSGCGNSANKTLSVTATTPGTPGTITGNTKACPGDVLVYSVAPVTYASSYNWTPPTGASITAGQGTNTVSVTFDAGFIATGNLSVTAVNGCGTSAVRTKSISRNTPAIPSVISGAAGGNCNTTGNYSVTLVNGMTYSWIAPANTTITSGQGTNSIQLTFGASFISGSLYVNAYNGCGTSANRSLALTAKPSTPGTIAAAVSPMCIGSVQAFSIIQLPGAVAYSWVVPSGSVIQSGVGTNSITALIGNTNGNVTVAAYNQCGVSANKILAITVTGCSKLSDEVPVETLSVSPNPCNTCFVNGTLNEQELVVTDIIGRKINVDFSESRGGFYFTLSDEYAAGLYLIRNIRTGQVVKFEKQ